MRHFWRFAVGACAVLSIHMARADDAADVAALSRAFETARLSGDLNGGRDLISENATSYNLTGRARRSLLADLRVGARMLANSGATKLEPVRVVSQQVDVLGPTAVVTELIGADGAVPSGRAIVPRRRTLVWVKRGASWKLTHLHTSNYSLWERAITAFETADKEAPPKPGGVVFVGSSSIVGWRSLAEDFAEVATVRRGFGGSEVIDSLLYAHRIVTPYRPRKVAIYAGDNDIAKGKTARRVMHDVKQFVETIHAALPETTIGFIAIKPSLSRWRLWPIMKRANELVAAYADDQERVDYLDIATPMLGQDGMPQRGLFLRDGLHMNADGYAIWTKALQSWVNQVSE